MPLDASLYTPRHLRPQGATWVQFVAYERKSGAWDVFVFEPPGVLPAEWEAARQDGQHVLVGTINSAAELDAFARQTQARLGSGYEPVVAYREPEPDVRSSELTRRLHLLHKAGATGYAMRRGADGHFEFWARRKDLSLIPEKPGR